MVPKSGLIPFNPQREPYKSYSTRLKHFLTDAGVRRATEFHNSGKIPKMFKWLILSETGYLDPTIESDEEEQAGEEQRQQSEIVEQEEEEEERMPVTKKQKIVKDVTVIKNKRGRKPKNFQNSDLIASPKPMNPSDVMKIEALISSKISTESINQEVTQV